MDLTQEQLDRLKQKLPADIVDSIAHFRFGFTVEDICGKYNLLISETDEVYQRVLLVIIGELHPSKFETEIKKALPDQDEITVKNIIRDVDAEIFQKLKEHLVKAFEKKAPSDGTVGPEHRDTILAEIENPHPAPIISSVIKPLEEKKPDIVAQKLEATVQSAPQSTTITVQPSKLPTEPTQTTPTVTTTPPPPVKYSSDPYREQV